jgi:predicted amidohydrolase
MIDNITIGLFQTDIEWKSVTVNQNKIELLVQTQRPLPELLFLPEMYSTGFITSPLDLDSRKLSEQIEWQKNLSINYGIGIIGSVVLKDGDKYCNRMLYTTLDGNVNYYDKRHLFMIEQESGYFKAGTNRKLFSYETIKIMPQICYDLRFPVWSRNDLGYQILVYSANWPAARQEVWKALLRARAIENQCYVIGINRVGHDGNGIEYIGGSVVFDARGAEMLTLGDNEEYSTVNLSIAELINFRKKFPVHKDADPFRLLF